MPIVPSPLRSVLDSLRDFDPGDTIFCSWLNTAGSTPYVSPLGSKRSFSVIFGNVSFGAEGISIGASGAIAGISPTTVPSLGTTGGTYVDFRGVLKAPGGASILSNSACASRRGSG